MIITLTLNPAIDKTVEVKALKPGELVRVNSVREDAGGKGINVSKTIHGEGVDRQEGEALNFVAGADAGHGISAAGCRCPHTAL